jgi:preprotein translocase subunit SecG
MVGVLLTIHVIVALLLIFIILIQQRGGGLSSMFGGGETIFGGRGASPFLTKTTITLFVLFILTSITLAFLSKTREVTRESAIRKAVERGEIER